MNTMRRRPLPRAGDANPASPRDYHNASVLKFGVRPRDRGRRDSKFIGYLTHLRQWITGFQRTRHDAVLDLLDDLLVDRTVGTVIDAKAKAVVGWRVCNGAQQFPRDARGIRQGQPEGVQYLTGNALFLPQQSDQKMFGAHIRVIELLGSRHRKLEGLLRARRVRQLASEHGTVTHPNTIVDGSDDRIGFNAAASQYFDRYAFSVSN